ncbi:unnamed protein product [Absidia cylindrospora]
MATENQDPLRNLLQEVLKNNSLAPEYDMDMMQRLNNISYLMQQNQDSFTLPVSKPNEISALQHWLEQLSANIQTGSCIYPDAMTSPPNHHSATTPTKYKDNDYMDYSSLAALMNSTSNPEFDNISSTSGGTDQLLYPNCDAFISGSNLPSSPPPASTIRSHVTPSTTSPWPLTMSSDQLLYPSSSPAHTPPASSSSTSSPSNSSSPSSGRQLMNDSHPENSAMVSSEQSIQPQTQQNKFQYSNNNEGYGIIPSFWKPGPTPGHSTVVQIPVIDGPAPSEEIDFTPEYHQVDQQPNVNFETSRTDVEPILVVHNKIDTSHAIKKEMMHMINVFNSPAQQNDDESPIANDEDKRDRKYSSTLNSTTTDGSSSQQGTTTIIKDDKHIDDDDKTTSPSEDNSNKDPTSMTNTAKPKVSLREEHNTVTTCLSDNTDDEEDYESPYADLVGHLQNISLEADDEDADMKLRERHTQLIDLLWRAAMRSTSSKATNYIPKSLSTTTTEASISSTSPSSPSSIPLLSTKALSPHSPLKSHSITA